MMLNMTVQRLVNHNPNWPQFTYMFETADWRSSRVIATDILTPVKALRRGHCHTQTSSTVKMQCTETNSNLTL